MLGMGDRDAGLGGGAEGWGGGGGDGRDLARGSSSWQGRMTCWPTSVSECAGAGEQWHGDMHQALCNEELKRGRGALAHHEQPFYRSGGRQLALTDAHHNINFQCSAPCRPRGPVSQLFLLVTPNCDCRVTRGVTRALIKVNPARDLAMSPAGRGNANPIAFRVRRCHQRAILSAPRTHCEQSSEILVWTGNFQQHVAHTCTVPLRVGPGRYCRTESTQP